MLAAEEIIKTALGEHDFDSDASINRQDALARLQEQLSSVADAPNYHPSKSKQLSIVKFRCMLQDTGYPLEVYMPASDKDEDADELQEDNVDWSKLQERWVGWGVEIPGEQSWIQGDGLPEISNLSITGAQVGEALPDAVHSKYPLASAKGRYAGALIKNTQIYDPSISFRPGTAHTFTGILSTSQLPSNGDEDYASAPSVDSPPVVPVLHVLTQPSEATTSSPSRADRQASVEEVIDYLANGCPSPDKLAAEFLLLALLASVTSRIPGGLPLGSLSLNLLFSKALPETSQAFPELAERVAAVSPRVVPVNMSLELLKGQAFHPVSSQSASSSSLQSGLLQLAQSTVVLLNEDSLESGQLNDRGVRNVRTLSETMRTQRLRYEYPFTDEGFGMDVDLGFVVCGVGKSLLPVDLHVPISSARSDASATASSADLPAIRSFLAQARAGTASLSIPDDVAEYIQVEFVRLRKDGFGGAAPASDAPPPVASADLAPAIGKRAVAEEDLKRWMKLARLMALTTPDKTLSKEVWARTLRLDAERLDRLDVR